MMVVAKELFLDLTQADVDPHQLLLNARRTALAGDVRELTLISSLDRTFSARELGQIVHQASLLSSLSLFSVALSGSPQDFSELAEALRTHRALKEVHLVDCGMMTEPSAVAAFAALKAVTTDLEAPQRPLDAILMALSQIRTLENVEIYAVPQILEDDDDDDDFNEDDYDVEYPESASEDEIMSDEDASSAPPVGGVGAGVGVGVDANVDIGDDDDDDEDDISMDDNYDDNGRRDIRGFPSSRRGRCQNRHLMNMAMNPASIAALVSAPNLVSLSLEDLDLHDDHITQMAQALTGNCSLQSLKLWGCNIEDRHCYAIAHMLQHNKTLEKLDLSYNQIQDDGCIAIAVALRFNVALRWLCLIGNDCTSAYKGSDGRCYDALLELLQNNSILEDLILESQDQDDRDLPPAVVFVPVPE